MTEFRRNLERKTFLFLSIYPRGAHEIIKANSQSAAKFPYLRMCEHYEFLALCTASTLLLIVPYSSSFLTSFSHIISCLKNISNTVY